MKVRALVTLLLVFALGATHASAGARFAEREAHAPSAPKAASAARQLLTDEEDREARRVAEAVFKQLEEGQDFAPLVGEMFVGDFAERLHASAGTAGSLYFLDRLAAAEATRDEVLRHHVAFSNLMLLTSLYVTDARLAAGAAGVAEEKKAGGAAGEDEEAAPKASDILPPEVLGVFRADPLLARFVAGGESRPEGAGADSYEEDFIATAEQLRSFTPAVERANELLRRRLTSEQKKRVFDHWRAVAESEGSDLMRPYAAVTSKEWYGYPEGTRLLCFGLLIFQFELVRAGAGYKVLSVKVSD